MYVLAGPLEVTICEKERPNCEGIILPETVVFGQDSILIRACDQTPGSRLQSMALARAWVEQSRDLAYFCVQESPRMKLPRIQ